MGIFIIIAIVLIIIIYTISIYNKLVKNREMVKNSKGQVAAQIESRWDAISTLIDATKLYEKQEEKVLRKITENRSEISRNSNIDDFNKDDSLFEKTIGKIIAVAENYPDLKASQVYQNTMTQIGKFEDNVRHSRMIYNDTVTKLNTAIQSFPSNLIASIFNFKEEMYFENTKEKTDIPKWN